jgi:hypothetical protein
MKRSRRFTIGATLVALSACSGCAPLYTSASGALESAREARCVTAICFGGDTTDPRTGKPKMATKYAIEPLAELPVGKAFTAWDSHSLGTFINNHDVSVQLAAGLRFWAFDDLMSVSVYLAKPLIATDDHIRVQGSTYEQPVSRVKQPYPGVALGFMGDMLWLGFDINELHNGSSDSDRDLRYGRDQVISRAYTFTLALTPITTARNAIGAANMKSPAPPPATPVPSPLPAATAETPQKSTTEAPPIVPAAPMSSSKPLKPVTLSPAAPAAPAATPATPAPKVDVPVPPP